MAESIVQIVDRHSEAYNAKDIEKFVSCFSDKIKFYRPPLMAPVMNGKGELREFYGSQRFHLPDLRSELLNRMVIGNKVIDHERTYGITENPIEAVLVNEVIDGLIETVWVFTS